MKVSLKSTYINRITSPLLVACLLSACGKPNGPEGPFTPSPAEQVELEEMNENAPLVEAHLHNLDEENSLKPGESRVSENSGGVGRVRVKIFPHDHARSNTPQGRDTTVSSVRLKSEGACRITRSGQETRVASLNAQLTTTNLTTPSLIECDQPITVVRARGTSYRYDGIIEATRGTYKNGKKFVRLVNIIDHEDYLKGVVPAEVSASWPMETLKAQAVAARSYSLAIVRIQTKPILERVGEADLDDTIYYQAYVGLNKSSPRTDEAIEETRGQVLMSGNRVAQAFFSADAGGHTESSEGAWGMQKLSYCRAKKEPFNYRLNPTSDWTKTLTLAQLTRYAGGSVTGISVGASNRTSSGRASQAVVTLASGSTKKFSGLSLASAFGMRSNFYTPTVSGSQVVFRGKGFGHGVGMSQWGARILAEHSGWNYRQILEFYYDDTTLIRLVNSAE